MSTETGEYVTAEDAYRAALAFDAERDFVVTQPGADREAYWECPRGCGFKLEVAIRHSDVQCYWWVCWRAFGAVLRGREPGEWDFCSGNWSGGSIMVARRFIVPHLCECGVSPDERERVLKLTRRCQSQMRRRRALLPEMGGRVRPLRATEN